MLIILITLIIFSSMDDFITGIVFGINNIKLSIFNIIIINIIIVIFLFISHYLKDLTSLLIAENIVKSLSAILFLYLSSKKMYNYLKKRKEINIIDQEKYNKKLSNSDILIIFLSLSIDNLLICFNTGIINNNFMIFVCSHFIIGNIFLYISNRFSYKFKKIKSNISDLVNSILFMVLALSNIF